jgi:hypothetical protein
MEVEGMARKSVEGCMDHCKGHAQVEEGCANRGENDATSAEKNNMTLCSRGRYGWCGRVGVMVEKWRG